MSFENNYKSSMPIKHLNKNNYFKKVSPVFTTIIHLEFCEKCF
jgi:hypothetical protein